MDQQRVTTKLKWAIVFLVFISQSVLFAGESGYPIRGKVTYILEPEFYKYVEILSQRRTFEDVSELVGLIEYSQSPHFRSSDQDTIGYIPALQAAANTFGQEEIPLVICAGLQTGDGTLRARYALLLNLLTDGHPKAYVSSIFGEKMGPKLASFCELSEKATDLGFSVLVGDPDAEAKAALDNFVERLDQRDSQTNGSTESE